MARGKTGLILGGLVLTVGAGVGIYFLRRHSKKYKEAGPITVAGPPVYYGDWNTKETNAWKRQQSRLHAQRLGVPQVF